MIDYTPGPWEWRRNVLNSDFNTADGSRMDDGSVVLMLTSKAKYRMNPTDAVLIASAPILYEAVNECLELIQSTKNPEEMTGIIESILGDASSDVDAAMLKEMERLTGKSLHKEAISE